MATSPEMSPEGKQMLQRIVQRYGDRFTPEQLAEVRTGVAALEAVTVALRAVRLENSQEPGTIFVPYCQEE